MTSSEKRVTTWTFDKACATMEINDLHKADIIVSSSSSSITDVDSDLIVVGLFGPSSDDSSETVSDLVLSGKIKDLDDELGGGIAEAMMENKKAFKHGSVVGSTVPTIRVVTAGKKVCCFEYL